MKVGELFSEITLDDTQFNRVLDRAGKKFGGFKAGILGAVGAVTGSLAGVGAVGLKMASDFEESTDRMQAQLGATEEEAEHLGDIAQDVFENAFGDSVQTVQQNIATLRQNLGDMSDETTQKVTEAAMTIEDLFGASVEETSNVVKNLRDNFDDLSEMEAMDLITTGFQEGGDFAGDLLDTLKEYAPQFADIGFTADQFLSTLIAGADAGAWNMDKVGDAVKELNNTIMNDEATEALEELGLNAEDLTEKFLEGGEAGEGAFQAILAAIASIEDPVERNRVGVELFKTQWEDLGDGVVTAMAKGAEGVEDFEGRTEEAADNAYSNLNTTFSEIGRSVQGFLTEALEPAAEKLEEFGQDFKDLIEDVQEGFETDGIRGAFEAMIPEGVRSDLSAIAGAFDDIKTAIEEGDWESISEIVSGFVSAALEGFSDFASEVKRRIKEEMSKIDWGKVGKDSVVGAVGFALGVISGLLDPAVWAEVVREHWDLILGIILGIMFAPAKWVKSLNKYIKKIPIVGTIMSRINDSLSKLGDRIIDPAKNLGGSFINGFRNELSRSFPNVTNQLRKNVRNMIDGLKSFGTNMLNRGREFMDNLGRGIGGNVGTVLTYMRGVLDNVVEAAGKFMKKFKDIGGDIIRGIGQGIIGARDDLKRKAEEIVSNLPDWMKRVLGIRSPARKTIPIGKEVIRGVIKGLEEEEEGLRRSASQIMNTLRDEMQAGTDIQRKRNIRSSQIDLLEDEIEYLRRENATQEELNRAKEKEAELDELRAEKAQEYRNRIRDQKSIIDEINRARRNGEISQKVYNELIAEATTELHDLRSAQMDLNEEIGEKQVESIEAAMEAREEAADSFADMADMQTDAFKTSMNEQMKDLREKNRASIESFRDETRAFLEELERQKDAALDSFDAQTEAHEEAINRQIRNLERRRDAEIEAIDKQLEAMDRQEQADKRNEQRTEWDEERGSLNRRLEVARFMGDGATVEAVKQEIAAFEEEVAKQRQEWAREDKREALKNEKDRVKEQYELKIEEKEQELELYQERREVEREHLEARYEQRAEAYERERELQLEALQDRYEAEEEAFQREYERQQERFNALSAQLAQHVEEGKMTQEQANAAWLQAVKDLGNEQVIQEIKNQEKSKAALNEYVNDYLNIGQSYASNLMDGITTTMRARFGELQSIAADIANIVAGPLGGSVSLGHSTVNMPSFSVNSGASMPSFDTAALGRAIANNMPRQGGNTTVQLIMDGKQIGDVVIDRFTGEAQQEFRKG